MHVITCHGFVLSVQGLLSEARAGVKQQYGTIREALEQEEQSALQCVTKEENRVLGGLEEKLSYLRRSLQSVQQGLHTLESLADTKGDKSVQDQAFIMVTYNIVVVCLKTNRNILTKKIALFLFLTLQEYNKIAQL